MPDRWLLQEASLLLATIDSQLYMCPIPPLPPVQDTWQWSQLPLQRDQPAPAARDFCCMVALEGERLLLHGGLDHSEKRLDDTWIYHAPR